MSRNTLVAFILALLAAMAFAPACASSSNTKPDSLEDDSDDEEDEEEDDDGVSSETPASEGSAEAAPADGGKTLQKFDGNRMEVGSEDE